MRCLFALALLTLVGCGFSNKGFDAKNKVTNGSSAYNEPSPEYSPTNLTKAITAASKTLVQRLPTTDEATRASQGVRQYETVLREYLGSIAFEQSMRAYHDDFFGMSGQGTGAMSAINYNEPTNIVLYIIKNNKDYREALTATYCVDNNLVQSAFCNSFSSEAQARAEAAGVITTRGFLEKWVGPHGFRRVKHAFENFACSEYPDVADQGMSQDEISNVAKGSTANFNSTVDSPVCFNCHRSINPRASLFLNFNSLGIFTPTPVGQRRPSNTVPTEVAGRMSKIEDLLKKTDGSIPVPRYHGEEVANVRDYGNKFANGDSFKRCTTQRFFNFMMGREYKTQLPSEVGYLELKLSETNYNIKELLIEIMKSAPYINR